MDRLKRIFCLFLALAFLLTAPGVVPVKTEANAAVADSGVLSLALLFLTWAGVSFAQSDQAVTATQKFLDSKVATASALAALITKNVLVEGTKLLLTGDVRTAFRNALPDIRSAFPSDTSSGSDFQGAYYNSLPLGVSLPTDSSGRWSIYDFDGCTLSIGGELYRGRIDKTSNGNLYLDSLSSSKSLYIYNNGYSFKLDLRTVDGRVYFGYGRNYVEVSTPFIVLSGPSETFKYIQSGSVTGSASLGALESADLDESDKVYPIAPVTKVVSSGLAGSTTAPGLSAEEYEKILADVLASTAVIPTTPQPTTAEPEPTTATPDEDKAIPITPDILGGMFEGLKGWLQSLLNSILEAIQAIPEKIDSLWESMKVWWTQTIADVKAWIEVKIQSIGAWWTTFWAGTKDAIVSIAASITEFFTVTFPAWITDVKEWALALPKTLVDAIVLALTAVFVPAVGYWDAKVAALQAKFPLFSSILTTGKGFSGFFSGLGTRPPVIYIDLGSSASWAMGGRTIFLDLTWYSQYKPTMDLVIAGFLWLLFAWRFFLRLPGLLRGEVGTIDRLDSYLSEKRKKNGG